MKRSMLFEAILWGVLVAPLATQADVRHTGNVPGNAGNAVDDVNASHPSAGRDCGGGRCNAVRSDLASAVPEPGAVLLFGAGLLVLALGRVAGAAPPWRGDLPARAARRSFNTVRKNA